MNVYYTVTVYVEKACEPRLQITHLVYAGCENEATAMATAFVARLLPDWTPTLTRTTKETSND